VHELFSEFFKNVATGEVQKPKSRKYTSFGGLPGIPRMQDLLDAFSKEFSVHIRSSIPGFSEAQQYKLSFLEKYEFESMLDIGCSDGSLVNALSTIVQGRNLVGVDILPEMVELARSAVKSELSKSSVEFKEVDYRQLTSKFDVINISMVLQFISNEREKQLTEIKNLMSPGSILFLEEKIIDSDPGVNELNEVRKNSYKKQFFDGETLQNKLSVLDLMNQNLLLDEDLTKILSSTFSRVENYYSVLNFRGYLCFY
jgi:cyclopropane fatty-acyl-phospholipid synthase-like methyltransferase